MIFMIISLVVVLIAFVAIIIWSLEENGEIEWKYTPLCLLGLLIMIPSIFGNVKSGEVGIKTSFGKVVSTNLSEGIQLKLPWENIEKMNIKVQIYENEEGLETSTKDMQLVNGVKIAINYQLESDKAVSLYKNVGKKYESIILNPAIQETVKSIVSQYKAEELVSNRSEVSTAMQEDLAKKVKEYGINILSVSLKNFDFSTEYNASIERKTVAEQNALTAQQELETSKAEAEKKRIEAEANAAANKLLESTLTKEVLMQKFIEKWNGQLPTTYAGEDIMSMFNLN